MSENVNIRVSREEFQELREEVTEMRTAFIGINGQGGFRDDFAELKSDVKELSKNVNDIVSTLNAFKDEQLNNHKLFATKTEVNDTEHKILMKLNEQDKIREEARKEDKKEAILRIRDLKEEEHKNKEFNLKKSDIIMAKVALGISAGGLLISSIFKIIENL